MRIIALACSKGIKFYLKCLVWTCSIKAVSVQLVLTRVSLVTFNHDILECGFSHDDEYAFRNVMILVTN